MAKKNRNESKRRPMRPRGGITPAGAPISPGELPVDDSPKTSGSPQRAAPAPGVPMTLRQFEHLKKKAKGAAAKTQEGPAQEDRPCTGNAR